MPKYNDWLTEDALTKVTAWARDGLTQEQIAHNIGIAPPTLCAWKSKHSEFNEALKKGKEVVDIEVENALYKRAIGYEDEEVTIERVEVGTDVAGRPVFDEAVTKRVRKQQPPDVTAQIFWLKNRKPAQWRDKQDLQVDSTNKTTIDVSKLSDKEIDELIKRAGENE